MQEHNQPNYALKAQVISKGLHTEERKYYKDVSIAFSDIKNKYNEGLLSREEYFSQFDGLLISLLRWRSLDVYHAEAYKINRALLSRSIRLRRRIADMLAHGNCLFVTMTFNNAFLSATTPETRRQLISRYLKSQSSSYVANIDFGTDYGREHYHAVVGAERINFNDYRRMFHGSNINVEKIIVNDATAPRLGMYVSKLTNHAIKETTKRCAIIYSRTPPQC